MDRIYRLVGVGFEYQFPAHGGPVDDPEPAAELFRLIGHAVAAFGRFEHLLDCILFNINRQHVSEEIYREHPRTAFRLKIDVLARWIKNHPPFKEVADKHADTLPSFKMMWDLRNSAIHAYYEDYDPITKAARCKRLEVESGTLFHWTIWSETIEDLKLLIQTAREGYFILDDIASMLVPTGDASPPQTL